MGYRSQVRCLIYGPEEKLDIFITTHRLILSSPVFNDFKDAITRYKIKCADGEIYHCLDLHGEDWKWYDDYEDVKAWNEFMEDAPEMGLQYEFLRVGEDKGDIEDRTSDDCGYFLYTTRPQINEDYDRLDEVPISWDN